MVERRKEGLRVTLLHCCRKKSMASADARCCIIFILGWFYVLGVVQSSLASRDAVVRGTVAFASFGRAHYAFDIFALPVPFLGECGRGRGGGVSRETKLTDGESVNYNGQFVRDSEKQLIVGSANENHVGKQKGVLAYVSERHGQSQVFFNIFFWTQDDEEGGRRRDGLLRREAREAAESVVETVELQVNPQDGQPFMRDRPSVAGGCAIYVSTQQRHADTRESGMAVYSTDLRDGSTKRLTPDGVTDYSPSVSPSGDWVIVASDQGRDWDGDVHELQTSLYIFKTKDGSRRRLLVDHGGWPSWADESTFFFHRQAEDGWWSIYRATIDDSFFSDDDRNYLGFVTFERITPSGVHAFTPAASPSGKFIAVATRRPESEYRQIEIFDLQLRIFYELTKPLAPTTHHFNPFISPDSGTVGYHRCRGRNKDVKSISVENGIHFRSFGSHKIIGGFPPVIPHLEHVRSPLDQLSLLRIDGTFPSFSPDGSLIAYIPDLRDGVYVMRLDGSGRRKIFSGFAFATAWDWKREGVVYTSVGPTFASEQTTVHIASIFNAHKIAAGEDIPLSWTILTKEGTSNNAFPSPSPDGKFVVFRSGRSGHKNLYIMDAKIGEEGGLWQLTEGPWTDTMCTWSPDGHWISFSSDRDNPGGGSFSLYSIHPNGTGLQKVMNSSTGRRVNHPSFSPDSKSMVFTTDYATVSAEPISLPHQYQPNGEIFLARADGSDLQRLTYNAYGDGTPSWGRIFISALDLSEEGDPITCSFDDDYWLRLSGKSLDGMMCW